MKTRILLVGVGGYGAVYVEELLRSPRLADVQLVGAVDPFAGASRCAAELTAAGVPFYDTLEAFYAARAADLAVVSTPTQRHAEQAVYAMRQGSHVLIEKPLAATGALAQQMLDARDQTGRILAVGFQWCYDPAMLRLKADVDAGRLGRPLLLRALVLWPRDRAYFQRGMGWAGKKYGADGAPIFDCVASNATAHYLENMLWLTGRGYEGAAVTTLEARTARVNDIEMYDTLVLRAGLDNGAQLLFAASHAAGPEHVQNPMFIYTFENGVVTFGGPGQNGERITARLHDGTVLNYGVSRPDNAAGKLWTTVDAVRGRNVPLPCPAEAALQHVRTMERVLAVCPEPYVIPPSARRLDGDVVWAPGLAETLTACFADTRLPPEAWGL